MAQERGSLLFLLNEIQGLSLWILCSCARPSTLLTFQLLLPLLVPVPVLGECVEDTRALAAHMCLLILPVPTATG